MKTLQKMSLALVLGIISSSVGFSEPVTGIFDESKVEYTYDFDPESNPTNLTIDLTKAKGVVETWDGDYNRPAVASVFVDVCGLIDKLKEDFQNKFNVEITWPISEDRMTKDDARKMFIEYEKLETITFIVVEDRQEKDRAVYDRREVMASSGVEDADL